MLIMQSLGAGAAGAATTNVLHEVIRRNIPAAPRIDLLGMQAMAKLYRASGSAAPVGQTLYVRTLIGDLLSNTAYFSLAGVLPQRARFIGGIILGAIAGIGAVALPPLLALSPQPTSKTAVTRALTIVLYVAGGSVAGYIAGSSSESDHATDAQAAPNTLVNPLAPLIHAGIESLSPATPDSSRNTVETTRPLDMPL